MKKGTDQRTKLVALKRIEGQIRGVQKMIEEGRYCIDIINAIEAVLGALRTVEAGILKNHLNACVRNAFTERSRTSTDKKMQEIYELFNRVRR